ncbi:putative quinate permease [Talaromyces islandicus]|uniref:Putative quinate permease n=1 Tax=Talaromyces islandicus TaxID=28573 RepID=A0A0U1M1D4_TALIS|nr:putative quinate permease [Talaromyces islandicus]
MVKLDYNLFVIAFVAITGSFTFGFSNSCIGSVIGFSSFLNYFSLSTSSTLLGTLSSLFAAGTAIGALIQAWLSDKLGRVKTLQLACVFCIVGGAIQAGSVHISMLLVGRFISGFGVGFMATLVPIYQSEIAPPETRGALVGSHGIFILLGYALSAWIGYGVWFASNGTFQWRFELAVQVISPIFLLVGSPLLPESPRWLTDNGREADAFKILCRLHQDPNGSDRNARAHEEFDQITRQCLVDKELNTKLGKWALFTIPSYRKRLICGTLTFFMAQSTGVLVINNYQVLLYNTLGLYDSFPLLLYALYLTVAALMNVVSAYIMDKAGRKRLFILGCIFCSIDMVLYTVMVTKYSGTDNKVGNGFGVLFLFMFVSIYATTIDATEYVYAAEIFPTHVRSMGMGISIFSQAVWTVLYTEVAPTAFSTIGWKYYLVFILVPLACIPVVWKLFPETKGLSLEEIGAAFGDTVAVDITHTGKSERQVHNFQLAENAAETSEKSV